MNLATQFTLYAVLLALLIGFFIGAAVAWYVVDRDYRRAMYRVVHAQELALADLAKQYDEATRVGVRGEAHADPSSIPAMSFRKAPSGQFYDFKVEE